MYLNDLRVDAVIGIYEWERRTRQRLILDIEIGVDIRAAAGTDNIEDTLNYKAVAKRVIGYVSDSRFQLVETLAEHVAGIIMREFNVPWCRLRLNKQGAVKGVRDVGVIIERGSRE
jgi:dihydroneopterin aldolase